MAATKTITLLLFEDGKAENESVARALAERMDPERYELRVKSASEVAITDILAASLFLLGAESPGSSAYGEFSRILKGINLAGRRAAFFGASGASVAWLRGLCADSDISAAHADLVGRRPDHVALATWLRGIA